MSDLTLELITVNLYDPNPKPSKPLHTSTVAAKADYGSYRPVDPRTEYCSHQGQLTDFLLDEAWPLGFSEQCMCDKCNIVHCKWATVVYVQRFEDIVDVHKLGMCGPNSPYECASRIECRPVLCEQVEEQSNSIAVEAQAQAEADLTEEVPAATSTPSEPEGSSLPADRIAIRSSIETVTQVVEVNHFVQGRNGDTRSTTTWRSWSPWVLVSLINVLPFKAFL